VIEEIKKDSEKRMHKSVEALKSELAKMRTGRAHTNLLDQITVSYYGADTPLNQVANISVQDARTLAVTAWDKHMIPDIEKAIRSSDLGLNPVTSGEMIRVPLPPLTEERRKEMIKMARAEAETGRVAVRNIRRDAMNSLKAMLKEKEITEDEERRTQDEIQKLTDGKIAEIDKILAEKETDLMKI
jgi:ribosome recycling factor